MGDSFYEPPEGLILGPSGGQIGWTWNGTQYVPPPKPPEPALTESDYAAAIQAHIDIVARSKSYADGFALASYVSSTIPAWAAEATTFVEWRDQVWVYAYTELAKVQSGQRPQPTIAELVSELPQIVWPS